MKKIRLNIDDVITYCADVIPNTCSFCNKKPVALLTIKTLFTKRSRWLCNDCRTKWVKGELLI